MPWATNGFIHKCLFNPYDGYNYNKMKDMLYEQNMSGELTVY